MSVPAAVDSADAAPHGPVFQVGYDQQNIQPNLHVSLDGGAEVAAIAEARHGEIIARKDAQYKE